MSLASEIVTIFLAVFIVVDPFGIVPVFISLTAGMPGPRKRATILKALVIAFVVLCVFIVAGGPLLRFLGIQPGSFSVAGGILLFITSIDLLLGRLGRTKTSGQEGEPDREDVSIFPLAIPMLAGPGAITTMLLYASQGREHLVVFPVLVGSAALALAMAGLTMWASTFFLRVLGKTGVSVIERLMGIVLAGLSVQFVFDGLVKLHVIAGG